MSTQVPESRMPSEFHPGVALRRVGEMALAGLAIGGTYLVTGWGVSCLFAQYGIWCPFCGGTRMTAALLRGDPVAAFHFNPMLFIGGMVLAVACGAWVVELRGGPRLRPPASWGPITQRKLYLAAFLLAAVFMLGRNLGRLL